MAIKRPTSRAGFSLLLLGALSLTWSPCSAADDPLLGRQVPHFYAVNEPAISGILRFGRENDIPIGIVLTKQVCSTSLSHLEIDHAASKAVINQLARILPRYTWSVEHGTVVFLPVDLPAATAHFLSLNVNPYAVPEDTLQAQAAYEWTNIRASLRPKEGTAFSVLSSPLSSRWPPLSLGSTTVREVLDRLVSRKPGGAWILLQIDALENAAENRPFQLIDYSSAAEMISPCSSFNGSGGAF
jgi:hypothetical protein